MKSKYYQLSSKLIQLVDQLFESFVLRRKVPIRQQIEIKNMIFSATGKKVKFPCSLPRPSQSVQRKLEVERL